MPAPLFLSSGDLIADRRYDFAKDLQLRGDLMAAADVMAQAVEQAPGFASAWFALGEMEEELNQHGRAIAAYRAALAADPEDRHGATVRLMRLGATELTAMPPAYVRSLFDQYAPRFDKALRDDLNYRGPELLLKAVFAVCRARQRPVRFARMIDLGCGTGLAGKTFQPFVDEMIGIDLSPGMIARAEQTGLYARLDVTDMEAGLCAEPAASADFVVAADAFVYLGDLTPVLAEISRVLRPGGLLAFTVETHTAENVILGNALRYAHGESYIRSALVAASLAVVSLQHASTREDRGAAVPGLVVVAAR